MKKALHHLGVITIFPLLFVSCSKNDTSAGGETRTPPITPSLILNADTAWYSGTSIIVVTSNAQSVTMNNQVVNGSITINGLNADSTITFIATNTNSYGSSNKTASITVHVHSKELTYLCWDDSLRQYAKWLNISFEFTQMNNINWQSGNLDCNKYGYRPNGIRLLFVSGCDGNPNQGVFTSTYGLPGEINKINMGGSLNDNIWNVDSLKKNSLVLSQIKKDSDGITRWRVLTFKKDS